MPLDPKPLPAKDYLWQVFHYEPNTGELIWKHRPREHFNSNLAWSAWNGRFAGKTAGCIKSTKYGKKRIEVVLNWVSYFAHRIIWKMMTGEDPTVEIDHEDTDQLNNRWLNLREATSGQNKLNTTVKSNSTTGYKGVKPRGNRFMAIIRIDGQKKYLGTYDTPQEAHEVYMTMAKELHGEFFKPDQ